MQFIFVFLDRSSKLIVISRRLVSENYIMLPIYIYYIDIFSNTIAVLTN